MSKQVEHKIKVVESTYYARGVTLSFTTELWRNESKFDSEHLLELFSKVISIVVRERTEEMNDIQPRLGWRAKRLRFCLDFGCSTGQIYKFNSLAKDIHTIHSEEESKAEEERLIFIPGNLPDVMKNMSAGELMAHSIDAGGAIEISVDTLLDRSLYAVIYNATELSKYRSSSILSSKESIVEEVKAVRSEIKVYQERQRLNAFRAPEKIKVEIRNKLRSLTNQAGGTFYYAEHNANDIKVRLKLVEEMLEKSGVSEEMKSNVQAALTRIEAVRAELKAIKELVEKELL